MLAATPARDGERAVIRLAAARPAGRWHEFGTVVLADAAPPGDRPISFDPFLNPIPGLDNYAWTRRHPRGRVRRGPVHAPPLT